LDKYRKASFYTLVCFFIFSVLVTVLEFPLITVHPHLYLAGKVPLHVWQIWLCRQIRKDAYDIRTNLQVGVLMMLYCIHGQYFSPWYLFGYHQLIITFSFLFPLPKRVFNTFAVVAMAAFALMMSWRFENVFSWVGDKSRVDWVLSVVAITLVAILSHTFFTTDRNRREALVRKFGLIGLQTATVVHDVKGLLAAPRMNLDLLKKHLRDGESSAVYELIALTEQQLSNISDSIQGLNQIVALQQQQRESLQLSELVREVARTINLSGRNVRLRLNGEGEVVTERALLKSMIFNVFMNSVQAFRKNRVTDPAIEVWCSHQSLSITDNAGGFPEEVLKSLRMNESERTHTQGMGLFLISTGMHTIGGEAQFNNVPSGAKVTLNFQNLSLPKRFRFLP
jgi:K+-sensing histidine kinase KdpD